MKLSARALVLGLALLSSPPALAGDEAELRQAPMEKQVNAKIDARLRKVLRSLRQVRAQQSRLKEKSLADRS